MICAGCGAYTSWRYKRCPECGVLLPQPKAPEQGPERPGPGPAPGAGFGTCSSTALRIDPLPDVANGGRMYPQ